MFEIRSHRIVLKLFSLKTKIKLLVFKLKCLKLSYGSGFRSFTISKSIISIFEKYVVTRRHRGTGLGVGSLICPTEYVNIFYQASYEALDSR